MLYQVETDNRFEFLLYPLLSTHDNKLVLFNFTAAKPVLKISEVGKKLPCNLKL